MERIVDASAAIALIVESEHTAAAREIFSFEAELAAPDVFIAETTNGIWNHRRTQAFSGEAVASLIERLSSRVALTSSALLVREAFAISIELDHPVYDAFYIALALRKGAQIATFDERLKRNVSGTKYASLIFNP
ncbi:MAG TPA: type II toxin-antitoxin system VapC family toxin [Candidatus Acidoferrales bacterium]|jgi:predicted nucleic acid-binding protein|nr:type II toxin-antitoxin system VapC family toxin [Candidatus Acidoferrales bacterium]